MEKKNHSGLIGCLIFIIVILIVFIVLLMTGTISLSNNKCKTEIATNDNNTAEVTNNSINDEAKTEEIKTINDVVGEYEVKIDNIKFDGLSEEEMDTYYAHLTLYKNGIFTYRAAYRTPYGSLGNYVVNGNKIILNYWYNTGSSVQLNIVKGEKSLVINEDNSITDSDIKDGILKLNNINNVILLKKNNSVEDFDISNTLGAAYFTENNHSFADPVI